MTLDELNERLALTFEVKPTHVPEPLPHVLMGQPASSTGAWVWEYPWHMDEAKRAIVHGEPRWGGR